MPKARSRKPAAKKPNTNSRNPASWLKVGQRGPLPRIITPTEMRLLGAQLGTMDEAAAALNLSRATLQVRLRENPELREAFEQGKHDTYTRLRRRQIAVALDPEHPQAAQLLIHLGKTVLGQSEKTTHEHTGAGGGPIRVAEIRRVIVQAASAGDEALDVTPTSRTIVAPKTINGADHEGEE
jgi:hypothetical protein